MNTRTSIIVGIVIIFIIGVIYYVATSTTIPQVVDTATSTPQVDNSSNLTQTFSSTSLGYTIQYPNGFSRNESYIYDKLGPSVFIKGVKFTIPDSVATGTNLGRDSYLSIEQFASSSKCNASLFLDKLDSLLLTDNGTSYSVASSSGAGAGNRYDETVYALPNSNPCTAVRYFVHYSVFENYPEGSITRFDEPALLDFFDKMRNSLTLTDK